MTEDILTLYIISNLFYQSRNIKTSSSLSLKSVLYLKVKILFVPHYSCNHLHYKLNIFVIY